MVNELLFNEINLVEKFLFSYIDDSNSIYDSLLKFLKSPSKRIRSKLAILYLKANNSAITDEMLSIMAICELIHNASLIHDDIIDSSPKRRGMETIETIFSTDVAVLCGDYLLSLAAEQLLKLQNPAVLNLFFNCTKQMADAEIKQNLYKGKLPDENLYIEICRGKTACLFEALLESVALSSGLNKDNAKLLGQKFGIIFQIQNDLEPISAQKDRKNNLYTAINIFGVEKTNDLIDNYFEEMRELINNYPENQYKQALEDLIKELCSTKKNLKQM